jgi:hypothetical protein
MYVENKSAGPPGLQGFTGPAQTKEKYWISGPKKNGEDGLYGPRPAPIDEDVREEYWTLIRKQPEKKNRKKT